MSDSDKLKVLIEEIEALKISIDIVTDQNRQLINQLEEQKKDYEKGKLQLKDSIEHWIQRVRERDEQLSEKDKIIDEWEEVCLGKDDRITELEEALSKAKSVLYSDGYGKNEIEQILK